MSRSVLRNQGAKLIARETKNLDFNLFSNDKCTYLFNNSIFKVSTMSKSATFNFQTKATFVFKM